MDEDKIKCMQPFVTIKKMFGSPTSKVKVKSDGYIYDEVDILLDFIDANNKSKGH